LIVVDASVIVELLRQGPLSGACERRLISLYPWHAPHVLDLEVAQVLRRQVLAGEMSDTRGSHAVALIDAMPIQRWPHEPLMSRIWSLRRNVTAYDAAYLALAEALDVPMITFDGRLARSPGHSAIVDLVDAVIQ